MARSTGTPATPSASSIARRIEVAVAPRLAISPLRSPFDSAAPIEINFAAPESSTSLRMAHVFVPPTQSATKYFFFFVNPPLLRDPPPARAGTRPKRPCSKNLPPLAHGLRSPGRALRRALRRRLWWMSRHSPGFGIHHHLPREPQIHGIHAPGARAPLVDILSQQMIAIRKIGVAEVYKNRRRIAHGRAQSCQRRANIGGVRKIHFADAIAGAGQRLLDLLHELYE